MFLFSHPLWFALARLPFRRQTRPLFFVPTGPVCGQAALAHIQVGARTMDYMGCEMIGLYNALHFIGKPVPLHHILQTYERRCWLLLGGRWGADPYAAGRYLEEAGIPCDVFRGKAGFSAAEQRFTQEGQVLLLSFWLGNTVFSGAHAVTLVRKEGQLWGYNLHNSQNAPLPVDSLSAVCTEKRFIAGYLLT